MKQKFVVVTTKHRGVFGGYAAELEPTGPFMRLTDAQICVYWSAETRGVNGLSKTGPLKGSRVSKSAPSIRIPVSDITAIFECSTEAEAAWNSQPWS